MAKKWRVVDNLQMRLPIPIEDKEVMTDAKRLAAIINKDLPELKAEEDEKMASFKSRRKELENERDMLARNVSFAERLAEVPVEKRANAETNQYEFHRTDRKRDTFVRSTPMEIEATQEPEHVAAQGEAEMEKAAKADAKKAAKEAKAAPAVKAAKPKAKAAKPVKAAKAKPPAKAKESKGSSGKATKSGNGKAAAASLDFDQDQTPLVTPEMADNYASQAAPIGH